MKRAFRLPTGPQPSRPSPSSPRLARRTAMSGINPAVESEMPDEELPELGEPGQVREGDDAADRRRNAELWHRPGTAAGAAVFPDADLRPRAVAGRLGSAGTGGHFRHLLIQFMRLGVPGAVTRFYYDHREGPSLTDYVTTVAIFLLGSSGSSDW